MPVEIKIADLIRMELVGLEEAEGSLKPLAKRLIREGVVHSFRASTGLFMLQQRANGDCQYLDVNRRCLIYEKRPDTCRMFPEKGPRPGFCPSEQK